jgi:hypothetical protein
MHFQETSTYITHHAPAGLELQERFCRAFMNFSAMASCLLPQAITIFLVKRFYRPCGGPSRPIPELEPFPLGLGEPCHFSPVRLLH